MYNVAIRQNRVLENLEAGGYNVAKKKLKFNID